MRRILFVMILAGLLAPSSAIAQDPVKADPKHYKVVFENDQVRVLRITYGPNEKSPMHEHPGGVAVFFIDSAGKFTFPDGKTEVVNFKTHEALWFPPVKHAPESLEKPVDLIFVELKGKK